MKDDPGGRGLVWLLAAKVVCCGGLLLVATGVLSLGAIGAWFVDGGMIWPATAVLAMAAVYLWRRRVRQDGIIGADAREARARHPQGALRARRDRQG